MADGMMLVESKDRFATKEDCLEYLQNCRWPRGFRCPNCEQDVGYFLTDRPLIQCAVCRHHTSITAGTVFHRTRIPLLNWFWIIYMMASDKGGASASCLAKQLGMYYSTVWNIMQKIRHAMDRSMPSPADIACCFTRLSMKQKTHLMWRRKSNK